MSERMFSAGDRVRCIAAGSDVSGNFLVEGDVYEVIVVHSLSFDAGAIHFVAVKGNPGVLYHEERFEPAPALTHYTVDAIRSSHPTSPMSWRSVYADREEIGRVYEQIVDGPVEYHPAKLHVTGERGYEFSDRWFVSFDIALRWLIDPASCNEGCT